MGFCSLLIDDGVGTVFYSASPGSLLAFWLNPVDRLDKHIAVLAQQGGLQEFMHIRGIVHDAVLELEISGVETPAELAILLRAEVVGVWSIFYLQSWQPSEADTADESQA